MKTCSLREAKRSLDRLADEALKGRPTLISHGGKLLIFKAYQPNLDELETLIDEGLSSNHMGLNDALWKKIRVRGRKSTDPMQLRSSTPSEMSKAHPKRGGQHVGPK